MTVIVDTHVFVWWVTADPRISPAAFSVLTASRMRYLSAVTAFELTNRLRIGKLENGRELVERLDELVRGAHFVVLPVNFGHAYLAGEMPGEPRDPFDRLIAAQARIEQIPVLSADPAFVRLGVETIW